MNSAGFCNLSLRVNQVKEGDCLHKVLGQVFTTWMRYASEGWLPSSQVLAAWGAVQQVLACVGNISLRINMCKVGWLPSQARAVQGIVLQVLA